MLRFLAPLALKVRCFFVVVYADPFFSRVVTVQLIEVHGLRSEHVRVVVGQHVERSISLPPVDVLDAAAVKVFCSSPEVVDMPPSAELDPRYGARFTVVVSPLQTGTRACRLHAVDPATKRHIGAVLLLIVADAPEVKKAYEILLPVLTTVPKRLAFRNEATRPIRYKVRSADPGIVSVRTPELLAPALETIHIDLLFQPCPATLSFKADVLLFITSEDRAIQETRLLQL